MSTPLSNCASFRVSRIRMGSRSGVCVARRRSAPNDTTRPRRDVCAMRGRVRGWREGGLAGVGSRHDDSQMFPPGPATMRMAARPSRFLQRGRAAPSTSYRRSQVYAGRLRPAKAPRSDHQCRCRAVTASHILHAARQENEGCSGCPLQANWMVGPPSSWSSRDQGIRVGRLVRRIVRTTALRCSWRTPTSVGERAPSPPRQGSRGFHRHPDSTDSSPPPRQFVTCTFFVERGRRSGGGRCCSSLRAFC